MKALVTTAGNFGPFKYIETLQDRYRCDDTDLPFSVIGQGEIVDADTISWPHAPLPTVQVPKSVTRRQARSALLLAGVLGNVQSAIDGIADPIQRGLAQIEWDDSQAFERNRPLLISLGTALGLDSAALDQLFITAAGL